MQTRLLLDAFQRLLFVKLIVPIAEVDIAQNGSSELHARGKNKRHMDEFEESRTRRTEMRRVEAQNEFKRISSLAWAHGDNLALRKMSAKLGFY